MPEEFRPLTDLVNTYLPDEAMKKIPASIQAVKCTTCGHVTYFLPDNPDRKCPYCAYKDRFL